MFTPERMHQINVMVFETEVEEVARAIVRLGILHLVQLDEGQAWAEHLGPVETEQFHARISRLLMRVTDLMKDLGIRELPLEERDAGRLEQSSADLDEMEREIGALEQTVQSIVLQRKELEVHRERLQGILNEVSPLTEIGLPPGAAPYTFLEIRYGQVRPDNLELIREKLAPMAAVSLVLDRREGHDIVLVIGLKTDRLKLKRILRDAAFEDIEMPAGEESKDEVGLVTDELRDRIAGIETQIDEAGSRLAAVKREHAAVVTDIGRSLRVAEMLLKVKAYLKKTRKTYVFSGWVPNARKRDVEAEILRAARGRAIIEIVPPEKITGFKQGQVRVPVMLKNPGFFRPFEMLVSSYGLPEYSFVDPTFFVAISFLIMFGAMFGDVGHGAVLAAIGWLIGFRGACRRRQGTVLVGKLAFYCGLSSVVFGLLYGSVFGIETLLPGLWLSPMSNVPRFFKFVIFFGVVMISIGIMFNIVNAVRAQPQGDLLRPRRRGQRDFVLVGRRRGGDIHGRQVGAGEVGRVRRGRPGAALFPARAARGPLRPAPDAVRDGDILLRDGVGDRGDRDHHRFSRQHGLVHPRRGVRARPRGALHRRVQSGRTCAGQERRFRLLGPDPDRRQRDHHRPRGARGYDPGDPARVL